MTRILVTGSRVWRDKIAILNALMEAFARESTTWPITIVHGGQKRWDKKTQTWIGADYLADEIAKEIGLEVDPHPVTPEEWDTIGKKAGPLRNKRMVDTLNPLTDVCLAFPLGESRGTRGCMALAEEAGIPVLDRGISITEQEQAS